MLQPRWRDPAYRWLGWLLPALGLGLLCLALWSAAGGAAPAAPWDVETVTGGKVLWQEDGVPVCTVDRLDDTQRTGPG